MDTVITSDPESHLGVWVVSAGKAHRSVGNENTMHHENNQLFLQHKVEDTEGLPAISTAHDAPG